MAGDKNKPFKVGKPVTGDQFYDRTKMLHNVKTLIRDGQDFMIKAPRRYGKTSLIKQALIQTSSSFIYIDLRRESRLEDVAEQIVDFAFDKAGVKGFFRRLKENVASFMISAKHEVKIKSELFEYAVEYFADEKKTPCEMLRKALETTEEIASELGDQFVVVFDEFQDIRAFNCEGGDLLEMLRGVIQHHESNMYVFLGSIEHLMTQIFESRKSPFYNYCRKLKLSGFDIDELAPQLIGVLKSRKIVFEDEKDLYEVLHRLHGHPTNTMLVMQQLYYISLEMDVKLIRKENLLLAYEEAYEETLDLIEQYVNELKQKKNHYDVLKRIARDEPQKMSPQAVNQVLKGLMEMGFLNKIERGSYIINDGFLVDYLLYVPSESE
jgi:AAA+ ATPase superfamily predicted ATPase